MSRILLPDAPDDQREILAAGGVACWSEPVEIDTYAVGEPDEYPLFLDRRVYQGSSGRVYPLPMTDSVSHEKRPRRWAAIHLENAYVRLMLLPEIGGRIHVGYDKVAGYDFFYRNNVIKPALVGLAGPWISGGVEFNWPQHHRPGTFLPMHARIERETDGAVVVWHSDLDPLQRMRSRHGIRLRPGCSVIEADVVLHNRTDTAQTFLWWANVAARAHERYQSFFPDDVAFVADHARRAITAFPRADRPYYGVDYPALAASGAADADRIDIYAHIPVPTSYMVTDTEDEFFGGYDHDADAGFVHWADRAVSPGKKQWTWGNGDIGHAWDRQLTDGDGPYVELMAGVFTDNQPDFSWLLPGETRTFRQLWYPIHRIGPARQASPEGAVSVSEDGARTTVGVLTTSPRDVRVVVRAGDRVVADTHVPTGPDAPHLLELGNDGVTAVSVSHGERMLVEWRRRERAAREPWVASAPPRPEEIGSTDELQATATHLLQYRHPSRSPVPYLREVLRRDPADTRAATALAAWHLGRGEYDAALELLERAMARQTARNLNPRDGETGYLLGLVHERRGELAAASDRLARAAWNHAWQAPATLARARIALREGRPTDALALARAAGAIPEARRLAVLALRRLGAGAATEAEAELAALQAADPLDPITRALAGELAPLDPREPLTAAIEFARAGAYDEALDATRTEATGTAAGFGRVEPLRHYLRALWSEAAGRPEDAARERTEARAASSAGVFPSGLDEYDALTAAVRADPDDATARALRGMWLLDAGRHADARADLERATIAGTEDPVAWRNLALALVRSGAELDAADAAYGAALRIRRDARLVFERDVLARLRHVPASERLRMLLEHRDVLLERDDLALEYAVALLDADRVGEAWTILSTRTFRPFEGGEGRVIAAYDRAACALARERMATDPAGAAAFLRDGLTVPESLGEGRHPADSVAERLVTLGDALSAAGDERGAREAWSAAIAPDPLAVAPREIVPADYWAGAAALRLGDLARAAQTWEALRARARELEAQRDEVDYFATSLPELLVFDTDTTATRRGRAERLRAAAARGEHETKERTGR